MQRATHWNQAYGEGDESRSWFQAEPATSLRLIEAAGSAPAAIAPTAASTASGSSAKPAPDDESPRTATK